MVRDLNPGLDRLCIFMALNTRCSSWFRHRSIYFYGSDSCQITRGIPCDVGGQRDITSDHLSSCAELFRSRWLDELNVICQDLSDIHVKISHKLYNKICVHVWRTCAGVVKSSLYTNLYWHFESTITQVFIDKLKISDSLLRVSRSWRCISVSTRT